MSDTGLTPAEAAAAAMQRSVFGDDAEANSPVEPTKTVEPQREELSDFIEPLGCSSTTRQRSVGSTPVPLNV